MFRRRTCTAYINRHHSLPVPFAAQLLCTSFPLILLIEFIGKNFTFSAGRQRCCRRRRRHRPRSSFNVYCCWRWRYFLHTADCTSVIYREADWRRQRKRWRKQPLQWQQQLQQELQISEKIIIIILLLPRLEFVAYHNHRTLTRSEYGA